MDGAWTPVEQYPWWRKRRCPHSRLRPIYGDEINRVGGWRLYCLDCGRFIDGPASLAESRRGEWGAQR